MEGGDPGSRLGVKMFRPYLHGVHFFLHTDHRPLLWLLTAKEPTGQQARWVLSLQEYQFSLVHRPGAKNIADMPSRYPLDTTTDTTGARLNATGEPLQHPLPTVLCADGTPDTTDYTHDLLTQQHAGVSSAAVHQSPAAALLQCLPPTVSPSQLDCHLLEFASALSDSSIDSFAPVPAALLAGHNGSFADSLELAPDGDQPWAVWRREQLEQAADRWVQQAQPQLAGFCDLPSCPGQTGSVLDEQGVALTTQLCTAPIAEPFFSAAATQGTVLLEPFGGLCAGLEMALRNGTAIKQYYYLDTDPMACAVAKHRLQHLMSLYPTLLSANAVQGAFSLPNDIRALSTAHLVAAGAQQQQHPWLVVAGWPCQDFSRAGKAEGLLAERASLLHELVRVIGALQQLQPHLPPAYIIENVAMQFHSAERIAVADYNQICSILGNPTVLDAAQFGSLAHRVRNFWTNLCTPAQLCAAAAQVERPPGRTVSMALGPGRSAQPVKVADRPPRFCCNVPGQPMQAWPTLMAHPNSYAYRPGEPGSIINREGNCTQPTADEREFALGYPTGSTAAPGVSELQRRRVLGECMDSHCMQALYAITSAWWRALHPQHPAVSESHISYTTQCETLYAAAAQEQLNCSSASNTDIWLDTAALQLLQQGVFPEGTNALEKSRLKKRLQYYQWHDGKLLRRLPSGVLKEVPRPEQRLKLIKQMHERCGHFGTRRTTALVLTSFWWHGLQADVTNVVSGCKECSRIKASFKTADPPTLQPLPIKGLGYRWGVDLAGPLPQTSRGNVYVMICVEHFSKHIEAIPIRNKTPEETAYAFAHNVLARFGACAELVHDQGTEWGGVFSELLQDALIDSRPTSASHPQANGLSEKCVHTVKTALKKMCLGKQSVKDWDMEIPWLLLGYRCSPQRSTGFSPYELLYAQSPVIPPAVVERMTEPVDFDNPDLAAADLHCRREVVKKLCPEALHNLQIAQHRDELRYAHIRSGTYLPKRYQFEVGDFVYTNQPNVANALQPRARAAIYRIKEMRPSGVLILQGQCGTTTDRHVSQCAPCHMPGIDPTLDPSLADKPVEAYCDECSGLVSTRDNPIVLCDGCDAGWHLKCLPTPLDSVPEGDWLCPKCVKAGMSSVEMQTRVAQRTLRQQMDAAVPNLYPNKQMRERDTAASELHGRLLLQNFVDPVTKRLKPYWGRVQFCGVSRRPTYFDVHFEDGDVYQYTTAEVKRHLQPAGTVLPAGVTLPVLASLD